MCAVCDQISKKGKSGSDLIILFACRADAGGCVLRSNAAKVVHDPKWSALVII